MKIKVLCRDIRLLKEHLNGKNRIMTYGAGSWAKSIKKMLEENGYKLDCAIVDKQYCNRDIFMDKHVGGVWELFQWKN